MTEIIANNMVKTKLITPGQRLKYVRGSLLKKSRAHIHQTYGLSPDTLAAWENGRIQITEKGIDRCIKIYSSENLILSKEWLLTGNGLDPKFSFDLNQYFKNITPTDHSSEKMDDQMLLAKEIEFFLSLSSSSITCLISSEDMLPMYSAGDYVGGRLRFKNNIIDCIGKDCIIKTKDGATFIRRLAKGSENKKYNLVCLNPAWNGNPEPVIFNIEIESAAPIIWHRRIDD